MVLKLLDLGSDVFDVIKVSLMLSLLSLLHQLIDLALSLPQERCRELMRIMVHILLIHYLLNCFDLGI